MKCWVDSGYKSRQKRHEQSGPESRFLIVHFLQWPSACKRIQSVKVGNILLLQIHFACKLLDPLNKMTVQGRSPKPCSHNYCKWDIILWWSGIYINCHSLYRSRTSKTEASWGTWLWRQCYTVVFGPVVFRWILSQGIWIWRVLKVKASGKEHAYNMHGLGVKLRPMANCITFFL